MSLWYECSPFHPNLLDTTYNKSPNLHLPLLLKLSLTCGCVPAAHPVNPGLDRTGAAWRAALNKKIDKGKFKIKTLHLVQHFCRVKKGWRINVIHLIACYCKTRLKINPKTQKSWKPGQRSKENCWVQLSSPLLFTHEYCLWVLENCCAFTAAMRLSRRNGGRQQTVQLQMCSRTRQSSQGSPGQIKPARASRYYVA